MSQKQNITVKNSIPTRVDENHFNEFILPHLSQAKRGPKIKILLWKLFNYILKLIYTGCQWKELPIDCDEYGKPEIHYTRIFKIFKRWSNDGSFQNIFTSTVLNLKKNNLLDTSILHGDGTTTAAKKGGEEVGFSGHKHFKGQKIVAFSDRNCNVISPFTTAAGNRHESKLFDHAFKN